MNDNLADRTAAWIDNTAAWFSPVFTDTAAYNNSAPLPRPVKRRTRARRAQTRPASTPTMGYVGYVGDVIGCERRVCSISAYWRVRPP
jgi:hypothetical protein